MKTRNPVTDYFYCPNKNCRNHKLGTNSEDIWYVHVGSHPTKAFGAVTRYKCKDCGKGFSDQTFSMNYCLKIKTDFRKMFDSFNSATSDCFSARNWSMSFESYQIRRERLARNMLYFQEKVMENHIISEPLCADGFESYTESKYYPNNLNILVGQESEFLYYFTESLQRRKGTTTDKQKERIETEYDGKSFSACRLKKQFRKLLLYLQNRTSGTVELHTDEHKTYQEVIKTINDRKDKNGMPEIEQWQTSSEERRDKNNPLFAVNYHDMLIRKDLPNHRRKTICYAKNDRNMLSRFACYMVSHNFFKPKRINSKKTQLEVKHFHFLELDEKQISCLKKIIFQKRMLLSRIKLPDYFREVWLKTTPTPLKKEADYIPNFCRM